MNNNSGSDLAMLDRIAALQKLCEEQKAKLDEKAKKYLIMEGGYDYALKQMEELKDSLAALQLALDGANHSKNLLHAQVEEQRVEIADRADTERSMAQAMLEDGEKIKELESQLAEKEKEKEKEIERLNRLLELTKNKWIEDTVKEGRVVLLQSQLATQTERVRVLEEALEKIADYPDEIASCAVAKQALNQESLGDGK